MGDDYNSFKNLVSTRHVLGNAVTHEIDSVVHIAFGADDHFIKFAGITILSILSNNSHHTFIFHVISEHISTKNIKKLTEIANIHHTTIILHFIGRDIFSDLQATKRFPKAIFNRLLAPFLLKNEAHFVLYLDSDIVCMNTIDELLSLDMNQYIAGVVTDWDADTNQKKRVELGLIGGGYFNSGVIYMNVPRWLEEQISIQALHILQGNRLLSLPDQDALNSVLDGKVLYMHQKFNTLYCLAEMKATISKETVILHYTGPLKPWHPNCTHPVQKHYCRYATLSPWKNGSEEVTASYKSKLLFHAGNQGYCD